MDVCIGIADNVTAIRVAQPGRDARHNCLDERGLFTLPELVKYQRDAQVTTQEFSNPTMQVCNTL
jgi:hypothetical protein